MTEPLRSRVPLLRPSSPAELSYTQLMQVATASHHGIKPGLAAISSIHRNQNDNLASATPAAAAHGFDASRSAPPASSTSNHFNRKNLNPKTLPEHTLQTFQNFQTPQPQQLLLNHPIRTSLKMTPHPHTPATISIHNDCNPQQLDRVANLAQKLNSMKTLSTHSQSRQHDIQEFITMLQGMQNTVSRTTDQQQRVRKSQALSLLLNMFERVLDERDDSGANNSIELDRLNERVSQLEVDNEQLHHFCEERDDELMRLHQELQQLSDKKEELLQSLAKARDECHEERKRAREAELVASESESVRDGLFASYGQLTEANVELERAMEECNAEKQSLRRDLEMRREETSQLQIQCNIFHQKLKDKDVEVAEFEKKLDNMHVKQASNLQSLELANTHRHNLQDELHASQRNATSLSQQLLDIRDQYTKLQKEVDTKLRNQQNEKSEKSNSIIQLQEEQLKRKDLEAQISKFQSHETAAVEQIRKLARSNAELKTRVNELTARLENTVRDSNDECLDSCSEITELSLHKKSEEVVPSLLDDLQSDSG